VLRLLIVDLRLMLASLEYPAWRAGNIGANDRRDCLCLIHLVSSPCWISGSCIEQCNKKSPNSLYYDGDSDKNSQRTAITTWKIYARLYPL
jgi:hypothetical protein